MGGGFSYDTQKSMVILLAEFFFFLGGGGGWGGRGVGIYMILVSKVSTEQLL